MADSTERRPAMRTVVEPAVTEQPAPKPQTQAAAPNKTGRKVAVAIDTPVEKPPAKPKPPAQQHVVSQAAPVAAPAKMQVSVGMQEESPRPAASVATGVAEQVEQPTEESEAPRNEAPSNAESAPSAGGATSNAKQFSDIRHSASGWVHRTFAGHEHAFWGGVIALTIALLVFLIGFWRVLFIGILVLLGVAIGQFFDGDPKLIRLVRDLIDNDRDQK